MSKQIQLRRMRWPRRSRISNIMIFFVFHFFKSFRFIVFIFFFLFRVSCWGNSQRNDDPNVLCEGPSVSACAVRYEMCGVVRCEMGCGVWCGVWCGMATSNSRQTAHYANRVSKILGSQTCSQLVALICQAFGRSDYDYRAAPRNIIIIQTEKVGMSNNVK